MPWMTTFSPADKYEYNSLHFTKVMLPYLRTGYIGNFTGRWEHPVPMCWKHSTWWTWLLIGLISLKHTQNTQTVIWKLIWLKSDFKAVCTVGHLRLITWQTRSCTALRSQNSKHKALFLLSVCGFDTIEMPKKCVNYQIWETIFCWNMVACPLPHWCSQP